MGKGLLAKLRLGFLGKVAKMESFFADTRALRAIRTAVAKRLALTFARVMITFVDLPRRLSGAQGDDVQAMLLPVFPYAAEETTEAVATTDLTELGDDIN